jgi:hypothetical protein
MKIETELSNIRKGMERLVEIIQVEGLGIIDLTMVKDLKF